MTCFDFDREFEKNLTHARRMILKIKEKADRSIALKYIRLLIHLKADDLSVKKNRNAFFKYFLQVLEAQMKFDVDVRMPCTCKPKDKEVMSEAAEYLKNAAADSPEKVLSHWSKDNQTFVSAKIMPGRGALLYMAVSSKPESGWDIRRVKSK